MVENRTEERPKGPLIGIGCAALMAVVALIVTVGAALAPAFTDGRASVDESAPFMVGGGTCCFFSGLLLVGAIAWYVMATKNDDE